MKNKVSTLEQCVANVKDGQTILFGDWHGELSAEEVITGVLEKGVKDIEAIAVSGGMPDQGVGRLIVNKQVKTLRTTHIGLNPVAKDQMFAGELEVEFIPQGTFAERIRAGGFGLGGVLTPTGVGTDVANGKQVINVDGKDYLLETALKGDVCLIKGSIVDKLGNVYYKGTTKNFCPLMAAACKTVIVEAEKVVEPGEIEPEDVMTPFVLVDYIVEGGKN